MRLAASNALQALRARVVDHQAGMAGSVGRALATLDAVGSPTSGVVKRKAALTSEVHCPQSSSAAFTAASGKAARSWPPMH